MDRSAFLQALPFLHKINRKKDLNSTILPIWNDHISHIENSLHKIPIDGVNDTSTNDKNNTVHNTVEINTDKSLFEDGIFFPATYVVSIEPKSFHDDGGNSVIGPAFFHIPPIDDGQDQELNSRNQKDDIDNDITMDSTKSKFGCDDVDPTLCWFRMALLPAFVNHNTTTSTTPTNVATHIRSDNKFQSPIKPSGGECNKRDTEISPRYIRTNLSSKSNKPNNHDLTSPAASSVSTNLTVSQPSPKLLFPNENSTTKNDKNRNKLQGTTKVSSNNTTYFLKDYILYFWFKHDKWKEEFYCVNPTYIRSIEIPSSASASSQNNNAHKTSYPPNLIIHFDSCSFRIFSTFYMNMSSSPSTNPTNNINNAHKVHQTYLRHVFTKLHDFISTSPSSTQQCYSIMDNVVENACFTPEQKRQQQMHSLSYLHYLSYLFFPFEDLETSCSTTNTTCSHHEHGQTEYIADTLLNDTIGNSNSSSSSSSSNNVDKDNGNITSASKINDNESHKRKRDQDESTSDDSKPCASDKMGISLSDKYESYQKSWSLLQSLHDTNYDVMNHISNDHKNPNDMENLFSSVLTASAKYLTQSYCDNIPSVTGDGTERDESLTLQNELCIVQKDLDDTIAALFPTLKGRHHQLLKSDTNQLGDFGNNNNVEKEDHANLLLTVEKCIQNYKQLSSKRHKMAVSLMR